MNNGLVPLHIHLSLHDKLLRKKPFKGVIV